VVVNQGVDLSRVAALANIDEDEMYQLNPAYKQRVTTDGAQALLVPAAKAQLLTASLSSMNPEELLSLRPTRAVSERAVADVTPSRRKNYTVRKGDNLALIAKANKVSTKDLQRWNKLSGQRLKIGQTLVMQDTRKITVASAKSDAGRATRYKVRKGDSLYTVAKRFNIEMQHLKSWNPRTGKALKPGQTLIVYRER
jgi:membrane-bound lytic murein transglycosylase D